MVSNKDMRRPDLIIPYQAPKNSADQADVSSSLSSTLPMAAMFMRHKIIGWASLVVSIQNWLGESEAQKQNSPMPGYLSVGMSLLALGTCYMPLFLPPGAGGVGAKPAAA
ncbi:hypothetical protein V2G26_016943 [Clonostachys chloroleuca]|nr:unnamed protein product [Clonostachys rosea f. rosea IK726]CAG9995729.1 unnamed protein product [Clonostachys byssicola]CAH0016799.1 unnamed protein product [Clonostachys rhizophaga]CAI6093938.1 unnamed protein product [Clonostachys chloroleuca]